ncbi:MAG TPA: phage holin family protein [Alphaproteobacteria bacterium]
MTTIPNRGVPDILVELMKEFTALLRREVRLARAEISEKISLVGVGLGLIVGGAILAMAALVILLEAVIAALVDQGGFTPAAAATLVGVVVLLIAVALFALGVSRLKGDKLAPKKTVEQLQRDAAVAKYQVTSR